jgi:hypothetical protein
MGQANTSLPDPLSAPASGMTGTDDLLSQLAGDEIDRLLAEADVAAPSTVAAELDESVSGAVSVEDLVNIDKSAVTAAADEALARLDEIQQKADEVERSVRELTEPVATPAPAPVSAATASTKPAPADDADAALNAELDALFDELNQSNPGQSAAKATEAVAAQPEAKVESGGKSETLQASEINELFKQLTADPDTAANDDETAAATPPNVADEIVEKTPVEVPASAAAPVVAAVAAAAPPLLAPVKPVAATDTSLAELANTVGTSHDAKEAEDSSAASVPLLLKPLEWVNAPFAALPDETREFLGKAAIITVVNALAVMMYVMFFRH